MHLTARCVIASPQTKSPLAWGLSLLILTRFQSPPKHLRPAANKADEYETIKAKDKGAAGAHLLLLSNTFELAA